MSWSASNLAKTLVTAVCRNIGKKIAMALTLFRSEKPCHPFEVTHFVAMSTARGRYQGLGEVWSACLQFFPHFVSLLGERTDLPIAV